MEFNPYQRALGDKVHALLRQERILGRIDKAWRSPQVVTFGLRLANPSDLGRLGSLADPLALALAVDLVRVGRTRGLVTVEIGLPLEYQTALALTDLPRSRDFAATLGQSTVKEPVTLDLCNPVTPHTLVAGTTGSGKTTLLLSWLAQLVTQNGPDKLRLLILDGKNDLAPFRRVPHLLHPIVDTPGDYVPVLSWATAELDRRKAAGWSARLLVVIDELAEVIGASGGVDGPAAHCLERLTALGRSLGVSVLVGTQHPTSKVMGGTVARANLGARAVGKVTDAAASVLATGQAGLECHRLAGRGDFVLVTGGDGQRMQAALPSERDLAALPRTGHIDRLDLETVTPDGALAATANLDPEHVAYALATGRGIRHIADTFRIGKDKATRAVNFAAAVGSELDRLGYGICKREETNDASN